MILFLREPEIEDAETILMWENDPENWKVSLNDSPYTLDDIINFISDLKQTEISQKRFLLCSANNRTLGTVDLCEIDFLNGEAFVGILIALKEDRGNGFGTEALRLLERQAEILGIHILHAWIGYENEASKKLFTKLGYTRNQSTQSNLKSDAYLNANLYTKWLKK